jgi:protein-S-isoprenylcysteine O-methyltransferase Ste14
MSWLLECCVVLGVLLLIVIIALRLFAYFTLGVCRSSANMKGKTIIITGANSGMLI